MKKKKEVYLYRSRKPYLDNQDENFKDRISLFHEEMEKGNISLKVTNVTEVHAGNYTCIVPQLHSQVRKEKVILIVDPVEKSKNGSQIDSGNASTTAVPHPPEDGGMSSDEITTIAVCSVVGCVVLIAVVVFTLWKCGVINDEGVKLKGENRLVCPEQVKATVGEDVTLDCHLKFPRDVTDKLFEWKFGSQHVLVYRSRGFSPDDQAAQFKDRAHPDSSIDLTIGKLPVKISSVQTNDAGTYSCSVGIKRDRISCSTELIVEPKPELTKGADDEKVVQHPNQSPEHGNTGIGTVIIGIVVPLLLLSVLLLD
ncbi:hypothetical protein L3Q82_003745 [Scortum barcoo]|uniref:Uncharacterized protein n=1 Tax=Scortum barcoo TaxID=214431 RepID=A0ACB8X6U1_9TELE|nr:hypothetical protein L3Q82_003745 [Scortum barcoo]